MTVKGLNPHEVITHSGEHILFVPYGNQFSTSNQNPPRWFLLSKENQRVKQNILKILGIRHIVL